jgi:hypothetical protein
MLFDSVVCDDERGQIMEQNASEVARLRQQIEEELEAMQLGFNGLAAGTARHDFIRARMEQVGNCVDELAQHIGSADATQAACEIYMNTMKGEMEQGNKK